MATTKLARDLFLSKQPLYQHVLAYKQVSTSVLWLRSHGAANANSMHREFSVFNEFSKKIKGEVNRNQEFQQSVKVLKEKTEELKGVKEDLKVSWADTSIEGPEMVNWRMQNEADN